MKSIDNGFMKTDCEYIEACSDKSDKKCRTCMNNKYAYEAKAAEQKKKSFFTTVFVAKE